MKFAPIGAVLLAAIAIATLAVVSVATAHATRAALTEYRVLSAAQSQVIRTERDIVDEETGIRGFAVTGDRKLLEPYSDGAKRIPSDFSRLRACLLAASRPDLLHEVALLQTLDAQWLRQIAIPTLHAPNPRATAPFQERGKVIVDQFRDVDATMERDLRRQLSGLFDDMTANIRFVTFIAALLFGLVAVIVGFGAVSAARSRVRAHEEKQLRALVAAMPQIVWIADSAGSAEYFNARWYDYTGQREQESLGGSWSDAIHPDDLPGVVSEWNVSVRLGIPYEAEYRIRNLDGRYQWFVVRALPERDSRGHVVRWFGTCTDVDAQHAHLESVQRVADAFAQAQLPEQLPSTPLVVFDATYLPAEDVAQVGGDWYDAFALDQHRFFFSVGDVTGHGLAAALTMSRVRQAIVAFASVENDPASILERTNRVLSMHKETMVTALCGTFDARTGVLQYASAGHPPSIVLGCDGQIREVSSHAPPLGVLERIHVTSCAECLEPGERLICYTDGIIENDRDVVGGEEYLHRVLRSLTPFEGGEPARAIRERVLGGRRGRDDIAILVLSRLDPAGVSLAARDSHVASSKG